MKPVPIPLRPDPDAVREQAVTTLTRAAIAVARGAFDRNTRPADYARKTWGSNESRAVDLVLRAASSPAMTTTSGWASELAQVTIMFLASLVPQSAGADLLGRGLQVRFDGRAAVQLPTIALGQGATFVGQGKPIGVAQFPTAGGIKLEAHKLATITSLSREMAEASDAEAIFRAVLSESAALGLDAALFSNNAGTADAPPGLLYNVSPQTASTTTPLEDAMVADLAKLGGAVARAAGGNIVFVAAPEQALAVNLYAPGFTYPVLASSALTVKTVIAVAANAVASGFEPLPRIDASPDPEIHMDTSAGEIVTPAGTVAYPVSSQYQTDRLALRMRMSVAWGLRASNAIAWMNAVSWP
jgi:hypothetical protein